VFDVVRKQLDELELRHQRVVSMAPATETKIYDARDLLARTSGTIHDADEWLVGKLRAYEEAALKRQSG
jgi:hypothetical protein